MARQTLDEGSRRAGVVPALLLAGLLAVLMIGYFLVFPPACYTLQNAGAVPVDSLPFKALSAAGAPCRWLKANCQPYESYVLWCLEMSER